MQSKDSGKYFIDELAIRQSEFMNMVTGLPVVEEYKQYKEVLIGQLYLGILRSNLYLIYFH
mgnify:CR=1 FL=1